MRINKLLKAFKNIDQIFEGVKNNIFKKDDVELIADMRWQKCRECEYLDTKGDKCAAPGTQPCCSDCGCSLAIKLRAVSSSCPKRKWNALLSEKNEEKFKDSIGYKD